RKQSEMVRYGLRKARYIGQAKVKFQAYLIATLVNFKRLCKLTMEQIAKEPLHTNVNQDYYRRNICY
ncbi:MAG: hypothetical protein M1609_03600, partial [Firmicutes bacterium]|nr:hypothetical protein [Bacillota bacterium]